MTRRSWLRVAGVLLVTACGAHGPESIAYGTDACAWCRMQIVDPRFGAELVTVKGRTVKFDSIECLVAYYREAANARAVASIWVSDLRHPGTLLDATRARFIDLSPGKAPMGRGWAAVTDSSDAVAIGISDPSAIKRWQDVL